jgi:hypothetical protein
VTDQTANLGELHLLEKVDGENRSLIYLTPIGATSFNDTITYKVGGVEKTVEIEGRFGAQPFGSTELYTTSFKAIFVLFILAVVVESGLQLIFRWRPYLRLFDTAAVNALVALAFSWFFVGWFDLDIATKLVNAYSAPTNSYDNSLVGLMLTAMIIAGGSAGVNRVFRAFGFRPVGPPAEIAGPRDDTHAWISVALHRDKAVGVVHVLFGEAGKEAVIGTIPGSSSNHLVIRLFCRNKGRFPQSGGHTVDVGDNRVLKLVAKDEAGNVISHDQWGPFNIGPRAIIDIERTL